MKIYLFLLPFIQVMAINFSSVTSSIQNFYEAQSIIDEKGKNITFSWIPIISGTMRPVTIGLGYSLYNINDIHCSAIMQMGFGTIAGDGHFIVFGLNGNKKITQIYIFDLHLNGFISSGIQMHNSFGFGIVSAVGPQLNYKFDENITLFATVYFMLTNLDIESSNVVIIKEIGSSSSSTSVHEEREIKDIISDSILNSYMTLEFGIKANI